jgi:phosphoribosyl-ATP pyrophosphohydrolase
MEGKFYIPQDETAPESQIGATLDALYVTISQRVESGDEKSYSRALVTGPLEALLKKVSEETFEAALAAKECEMLDAYSTDKALYDESLNHFRYEVGDVLYHLSALLVKMGITPDELAAELNARMSAEERPNGGALLKKEFIKRGK